MVENIDDARKVLVSYDGREVPFDLLVTVPVNMGADFMARSGLGDELNYVPVDKHTLLSEKYDNVFALGDANNIPTSKAGSVAHFSVDVFVDNFLQHVSGEPMTGRFDGHANCFVEAGDGKALLVDFNYDTQPLTGSYPLPLVGPLSLLKETRLNHLAKLAFRGGAGRPLRRGRGRHQRLGLHRDDRRGPVAVHLTNDRGGAMADQEQVAELSPQECWQRLSANELGRLAFRVVDEVHILPVTMRSGTSHSCSAPLRAPSSSGS